MKALQLMLCLKPSGSYKCCGRCANIFGRIGPENAGEAGYHKHFSCNDTALWDEWDHERFQAACAELTVAFAAGPEQGYLLDTHLGIYFNRGLGVPFGDNAHLCRIPECMYLDAQHSIWASGGVAQFHINQIILEAERNELQIPQMQEPSEPTTQTSI